MIGRETIQEILDKTIIEEVVGEFVVLKKRGVNLLGLCPFHNEKTPSFTVSPSKEIYKCFGCGEAGNSVNFLMRHEHLSYPEALKYLAKKYQVEIQEEAFSPEMEAEKNEKESLILINEFAQKYFEDQLWNTDEGRTSALAYLKERGFNEQTIKVFGIGYNPQKKDALTSAALEKGYQLDYLVECGLSKKGEKGNYDFFNHRIIFPIYSMGNRVFGFGARSLSSEQKAKYLNSAENKVYHKSKILYGLNLAKKEIVKKDNCYLVEGYTDVNSLWQAGVHNVVSSSGTALTTDQVRLIKRFTKNITVLFDGDAAGIKASMRGIDLVLEEGMTIRAVRFPEGEDPDSWARKKGAEALMEFLKENAEDFIDFKLNLLLVDGENDPMTMSAVIHDIINSISLIPDQIAQNLYLQKCGAKMGVEERAMVNELNKILRKKLYKKQDERERVSQLEPPFPIDKPIQEFDARESQEKDVLRVFLLYGHLNFKYSVMGEGKEMEDAEALAKDYIIHEIESNQIVFKNPMHQSFYDELKALIEQNNFDAKHLSNHFDPKISQLAVDLMSHQHEMSDNWEKKHAIYTTREEQKIKEMIDGSLNKLKLKIVLSKILENQKELSRPDLDELSLNILLNKKIQLDLLKRKLCLPTGTNII